MAMFRKFSEKRWRIAGTIAAVAVTTTAGGVAWAATSADPTPSPSASPSTPGQPADPGKGPGRGAGGPGKFLGQGGALHGEFVVPKDGGGYQTVATQRGQVTAVSKDSITVKSEDGFSRTYTLTEDTLVNAARDGIDDVKTGNTVNVSAVVADGKATASSVDDGTVRQAAGEKWGFHRGPR
ncbi:hypothetical protein ACFVWG_18990 [Kribbella sp. NPDC058245]|uniref:hypothetical protein n=1 Tax=Kribbella sp. NPDC058245 TaxID=3346399 RepID=UPI0036E8DA89